MDKHEKIRIALIYPPHKVYRIMYSLAYLSYHIKKLEDAVDVRVINCPSSGCTIEELRKELIDFDPHIIGISIPFTSMLPSGIEVLKCCRKSLPDSLLITGGTHATISPEDLFDKCDFVVIDDGEYTLTEMVKDFPDRDKIGKLSSIAFAKDGKMIVNPKNREWYENRRMEMPDWTGEDLEKYFSPLVLGTKTKAVGIFTSRGCVYNCSYCCNNQTKKIVYRKIDDVIKEIRFYIGHYGVRSFNILDELFLASEDRVNEFCSRIEKERLDVSWGFQTRANLVKNKPLFKRMRDSGALIANMGIESGNNAILKLNKNLNKETIERAVDTLKELGYLIYAGFIIGFPQDTIETVWQTITFSDKLDIDSPGFSIMKPYPKTEVRRIAEKEGGIFTSDFSRYSFYDVVYIPPGLSGYDLLAIRQFAFQYFHTRNENRLKEWLNRFVEYKDFSEIKVKYNELFSRKDTLDFDYLKSLKLSPGKEHKLEAIRLPI